MTAFHAATAVLAALVAFGTPAHADDTPTADELAARSHLASAPERRPETEREMWSIRVGGLEGTLETMRRGADVAGTTLLGPFRTARGLVHGEHWHQNENGETILDRPEPSQTERVVAQSVARVRQPVDAWVVTTSFAGGHVTRTFYDPRTSYVVRTERTVAGRTTHTAFDDFRTDARGRTRSWHYSGGDERPENDFDYRLLHVAEDPQIDEADLAIPRDRRALVEFPTGVDVVRLPARIVDDRIYVRLQIGGRGLDFLLDTGAAALTIDDSVAQQLGLTTYGRNAVTVAGTFDSRRAIVPEIGLGPLVMHEVVLRTTPFSQREAHDTRIVGLLGFDFIDALGLKIDYAAGTVDAYRPGTLAAPPGTAPIDIRLNSGAPVGRATIGDATGEDFILDTGAAFSYVIFQRFARAHPDAVVPSGDGRVLSGSGIGGTMSYRAVVAKRLVLGSSIFADPVGAEAMSPNALGFDNEDGLIGADLLRSFSVYLDYAASRLYLGPRGRMPAPLGRHR
ncbi:MAG: aspartyl protease family protein [Candidatus Eremiobacteraeota bacterium]|nr:aspartyl protease family protein [Candidatus Eremiobacteraeota bacterium]